MKDEIFTHTILLPVMFLFIISSFTYSQAPDWFCAKGSGGVKSDYAKSLAFVVSDLRWGIYFYRKATTGTDGSKFSDTKKMMLIE